MMFDETRRWTSIIFLLSIAATRGYAALQVDGQKLT